MVFKFLRFFIFSIYTITLSSCLDNSSGPKLGTDFSGIYRAKYNFGEETLIIKKEGKYKQIFLGSKGEKQQSDWKKYKTFYDNYGSLRIEFEDFIYFVDYIGNSSTSEKRIAPFLSYIQRYKDDKFKILISDDFNLYYYQIEKGKDIK